MTTEATREIGAAWQSLVVLCAASCGVTTSEYFVSVRVEAFRADHLRRTDDDGGGCALRISHGTCTCAAVLVYSTLEIVAYQ